MIFILFFLLQAFLSMRFQCFVINLFEFTVPKTSVNVESKKKKKIIFWIIIPCAWLFSFHMRSLFAEKKKKLVLKMEVG